MMWKLFLVLGVAAVLAFLLAVTAMAFAILGKPAYNFMDEDARVKGLAVMFQNCLITALVLGAAAWIVQP